MDIKDSLIKLQEDASKPRMVISLDNFIFLTLL